MKFIKNITQTELFKITSLNSVSVILKLLTGLVSAKVLAIFVGPSGLALLGNLRTLSTTLDGFSTLGFPAGVVQRIAENEDNKPELQKIIATSLVSFLLMAFGCSLLLFYFSDETFIYLFGNNVHYNFVFQVMALVLPFNAVSTLFSSVLNGLGSYKKVIYTTILSTILSLLLTLVLVYYLKTLGALLAVVLMPLVMFFILFYYIFQDKKGFNLFNINCFDVDVLKKLAQFSVMILPPMLLSPVFNLKLRTFLIANVGLNQAGYWEAMSRISNMYLLFVSTMISLYFYPKFSKSKDNKETKKIIHSYYKTILPAFIVGCFLIYFLRVFILKTLFTSQFLPVSQLFFWQLLADVFKVAAMILGIIMMAKTKVLSFLIIEISFIFFLYFISVACIKSYGLEGIVIGQAIDNFLYLIVMCVYFRKYVF